MRHVRKFILALALGFLFSVVRPTETFAAVPSFKPLDSFKINITGVTGVLTCAQKKKSSVFLSGKFLKGNKIFIPDDIKALQKRVKAASGKTKKKLQKQLLDLKQKQSFCKQGRALFITPTPTPTISVGVPDALVPLARPLEKSDIFHLYRRAGLGVPPDEALAFIGRPVTEMVDYFMAYKSEPEVMAEATTWLDEDPTLPNYPQNGMTANGLTAYFMKFLEKTKNPFQAGLVLALSDRLVVSTNGVTQDQYRPMFLSYIDLLIRASQDFDYKTLLKDLGEQGTMVKYLTLDQNNKNGPNENYARELMELFSLGTTDRAGNPNYTNEDIRQIAKAFTGWTLQTINNVPSVVFVTNQFDSGAKTIFAGTPYEATIHTGREVVDQILNNHPGAPLSLATFFAQKYISPQASNEVIDEIASIIKADGFNFRRALRSILISDEFYQTKNRLVVPKTLAERFVHLFRVMDRPEIGMPFDFMERVRRLADGNCMPMQLETVFGCLENKHLPDGLELVRSFNQDVFMSQDNGRFNTAGFTFNRYFPNAQPNSVEVINYMADKFGIDLTDAQRAAMNSYLNNTLKNDKITLQASPFNPLDSAQVKTRVSGLYIMMSQLLSDVK